MKNLAFSLSLLFLTLQLVSCKIKIQEEKEKTTYPLLLISIDGFRHDYLDKTTTPAFDSLVKKGSLASYVTPIFPSKTFPTHYSIVTGLYAENTGVIANNMFDTILNKRFRLSDRSAVQDPRWYEGEPIWVTAELQGIKAATLFWPGSEAPIKGIHASRWLEYDGGMSHQARIDTIIHWQQLPKIERPLFSTFYLSNADTYGHNYGPDSDSVVVAIQEVDRTIGLLIDELKRIKVWPNINLIITSDHGMTEISEDRVILIDKIIDLEQVHVTDWNPVAMIQPKENFSETIYNQLKENEKHYQVFKKEDLPEHYRLKNHHRVPEIIVIAEVGYTITTENWLKDRGVSGGNHGYDPSHPDMRAFFLAVGPDIKNNYTFDGFESVHIYEFMCKLLNLQPAQNDGNLNVLKHILKNP